VTFLRPAFFCLVALAGLVLCAENLLSLLSSDAWWVRISDFPRLQWAVLLALLCVAAAFYLRRYPRASLVLIALMLAALAYHAAVLLPYLPRGSELSRSDCAARDRLSVMIANVRLSNAPDGNLLREVHRYRPDVLLVLEVNQQWQQALAPLKQAMPYNLVHTTGSYFGIALYSRLPLESPEIRHLAGQDTPQIVTRLQLRNGETIDFLGIHPRPPHPSQSALGRDAVLLKTGLLLRDSERPGVVAGDLNATPWEDTITRMRELARLIDPRHGYGYLPTYNAQSWWMAWPLDHVLYEAGFEATELIRGDAFGSDHYPYLARLCRVELEESETADTADEAALRDARRTIARARKQSETKPTR
jgi:endonuclease/exonuclease/phosphatase (EEP) superfamily protein YafD